MYSVYGILKCIVYRTHAVSSVCITVK